MDESIQEHLKADHEPAKLDNAARLLLKAAELIEDRGWIQGEPYDKKGRMCIMGALYMAYSGRHGDPTPLPSPVMECFERLGGFVRCWNDEPGRTQDEVVAKLRAVALSSHTR